MYRSLLTLLPVLLFGATAAHAGDEGVFDSKELNFTVRLPEDSVDWDHKTIDEEMKKRSPTLAVWFQSEFADSDAYASVHIYAQLMPGGLARKKLGRIADKWKTAMEGDLGNPHNRKDGIDTWAGVDTYRCDLDGTLGSGNHSRTWLLLKNGSMLYTIVVNLHLKAAKDEDLRAEVKQILASFKFGEIRKIKGDRKAKGGQAPDAGDGKGDKKSDNKGPVGDPEKLKKAPFSMDFWRFKCVKPQNLLEQELKKNDIDNGIKVWWLGEVNTVRLGIRVYVWSLKNKTFTMDKLVDSRLAWKKRFKQMAKDPDLDKNYKKHFPMAKKAYRLEMIGRSTRRERWVFVLAECTNDRQYMIELYSMGDTSDKMWGKAIKEFFKSFQPLKK
jgi:hypothetical protein